MRAGVALAVMDDDYIDGKRTDYREAIGAGNGDSEAVERDEGAAEPESAPEPRDAGPEIPEPAIKEADGEGALTIALPDGSESVAEAMLAHRRMLTNPADSGLAAVEELEQLREAVETLSAEVPEELADEMATLEASVDEVADGLDRQQRQIQELGETVARLAEILGTSVEFRSIETGN